MKPFYLRNVFRLQLICVLLSIIHVSLSALLALVNLFRNFVEDIMKFHGIYIYNMELETKKKTATKRVVQNQITLI